MMMSIALRFIPILLEETDKIMKAQIARGADFESGKLMQRVKALVPILIPLIPGGSLYYTMRFALNRQWTECLSRAFYTLKLAMSLALGMIVVLSLLNIVNKILNHALYSKRKETVR